MTLTLKHFLRPYWRLILRVLVWNRLRLPNLSYTWVSGLRLLHHLNLRGRLPLRLVEYDVEDRLVVVAFGFHQALPTLPFLPLHRVVNLIREVRVTKQLSISRLDVDQVRFL